MPPSVLQAGARLSLRVFSSGLMAVQGSQHSDQQVCDRIAALVDPKSASAPDLSRLPLPIQGAWGLEMFSSGTVFPFMKPNRLHRAGEILQLSPYMIHVTS